MTYDQLKANVQFDVSQDAFRQMLKNNSVTNWRPAKYSEFAV